MTLDHARSLAARMLCIGFDGTTLPESAERLIAHGIGFCILFGRNVQTPAQVAALNASIKRAAVGPIGICVDQEGGRVRRLRDGFTAVPSMRDVGRAAGDGASNLTRAKLPRDIGRLIGRELRAVGFDIDFAPVLDVDTNPANPVIGDRSFARDPAVVARLGCELIAGLQDAGVAACGKHFPGHGDTAQDSHEALPRLDHDLERLNAVELVPFVAAVEADVSAIMTSHIVFTPLDATSPATLSPAVLDGLLRRRLGYDGVVFTDDMEMKAIASFYDLDDAIVRAIEAGADVVMVCHTLARQQRALDVLANAIHSGRLSADRVATSIRRIEALLTRFARPVVYDPTVLNCAEHRALVAQIGADGDGADPTAFVVE